MCQLTIQPLHPVSFEAYHASISRQSGILFVSIAINPDAALSFCY